MKFVATNVDLFFGDFYRKPKFLNDYNHNVTVILTHAIQMQTQQMTKFCSMHIQVSIALHIQEILNIVYHGVRFDTYDQHTVEV